MHGNDGILLFLEPGNGNGVLPDLSFWRSFPPLSKLEGTVVWGVSS